MPSEGHPTLNELLHEGHATIFAPAGIAMADPQDGHLACRAAAAAGAAAAGLWACAGAGLDPPML